MVVGHLVEAGKTLTFLNIHYNILFLILVITYCKYPLCLQLGMFKAFRKRRGANKNTRSLHVLCQIQTGLCAMTTQ